MIDKYIEKLNHDRNVKFIPICKAENEYHGTVYIDNERLELKISFSNQFPLEFPDIYLENKKRVYPHVGKNNKICLFDDSSILIQTDNPYSILLDAFDRAIEILSISPKNPEYNTEILKEFNAYWEEESTVFLYMITPQYTSNTYKVLDSVLIDNRIILSDSIELSLSVFERCSNKKIDKSSSIETLFIKINRNVIIPIQDTYSWKWLRLFILKNITSSQKEQFKNFLKRKVKSFLKLIVLMIPGMEHDIPVGFYINRKSNHQQTFETIVDCKVKPISIKMIDYDYMTYKTGISSSLRNKKILLLGCGSVGGYIAANLCQSGICNIDILDNDVLSIENVHRHILGFNDAVKIEYKAELMRKYIEEHYPFVNVDSMNFVNRDVREFLKTPERLKCYDVIVSALGEPTINLEINKILNNKGIQVPLVVCFNEPYSIGGHVIATNMKNGGCLQCLYTDLTSDEIVPFRASFVKENQTFSKSISGCAGTYVEYSALDAQQTALLACRLCLEIIDNKNESSTLLSWYGDSSKLINNGFFTSDYYDNITSSEKYCGIIRKTFDKNKECPLCKMNHSIYVLKYCPK